MPGLTDLRDRRDGSYSQQKGPPAPLRPPAEAAERDTEWRGNRARDRETEWRGGMQRETETQRAERAHATECVRERTERARDKERMASERENGARSGENVHKREKK